MVRAAPRAFWLALIAAASAPAEIVAHGVRDGMLSLGPGGAPYVAYVKGQSLLIAERSARGRWSVAKADAVSKGTQLMAFEVGATGPVALTLSADDRRLVLVRRQLVGWQRIRIEGRLPARTLLGWPGLALDRRGHPFIGYTRWRFPSYNTRLTLATVNAAGRVRKEQITAEGFPKSYAPPPAKPVLIGGHVHVIESYGFRGVVGTLEWLRRKHTWIGNGLDAGIGDFPIGAVFGGVASTGEVAGAIRGRVAVYRERPGEARALVARATLSGGAFSLVDHPATRPLVYRAVYTDPATGIPYAALLRDPVS